MFVDILYFVSKFQYFKEVITFNRKVVLLLLSRVRCLFIQYILSYFLLLFTCDTYTRTFICQLFLVHMLPHTVSKAVFFAQPIIHFPVLFNNLYALLIKCSFSLKSMENRYCHNHYKCLEQFLFYGNLQVFKLHILYLTFGFNLFIF